MMMGSGGKYSNDDVEEFARVNASNLTQRIEANPDAAKRYKRIYKCKEKGCDKEYDSHQALGGHRASHNYKNFGRSHSSSVPKLHTCKLCGMGFPAGQSLGGHMRKHRLGKLDSINKAMVLDRPADSESLSSCGASCLISCKKAFEFDLNMMPEEIKEEE